MKKLIGSLLIINLLTHTTFMPEVYAYELYRCNDRLIHAYVMQISEEEDDEESVNAIMSALIDNNGKISALMQSKNQYIKKIYDTMTQKASAKESLNLNQMEAYQEFFTDYEEIESENDRKLTAIDAKSHLKPVQDEIMKNDTSISLICQELKKIYFYQMDVLDNTHTIIRKAENLLAVL